MLQFVKKHYGQYYSESQVIQERVYGWENISEALSPILGYSYSSKQMRRIAEHLGLNIRKDKGTVSIERREVEALKSHVFDWTGIEDFIRKLSEIDNAGTLCAASIRKYLKKYPRQLKPLIRRCGNRVYARKDDLVDLRCLIWEKTGKTSRRPVTTNNILYWVKASGSCK